jgi:hypothetical protein
MVKDGSRKRKKRAEQAIRLTISLPLDDYTHLCAEAERMHVSLAWVIRRAVSSHVEATRSGLPDSSSKGSKK